MKRVPTYTEIGKRIKERRKALNLVQADVAAALKVSRSVVTKMETGKKAISSIEIKKIANVLNCAVDELMAEVEKDTLVSLIKNRRENEVLVQELERIDYIFNQLLAQLQLNKETSITDY